MSTEYPDDDILGDLDAPILTPAPLPAARPVSPPSRGRGVFLELAAVAVISAALAAEITVWWLQPWNHRPTPSVDAAALGRAFVPKLAAALAAGFDADADALHAGKSVGEADAALKEAFHEANARAFESHASQALLTLIPDGDEIKTQAQRDSLEAFHREFARGLRKSR